nr:ABC transporter ATP-binding protein [Desulfobulbaceae bacterium]
MIAIKNLVKRYDDHCALDHLDMSIGKGCIFGLLGPNGAGKTTLISILNGLTSFQEGTVEIFGMPLPEKIHEIRQRSSFIPQSLALYDKLSVMENLQFFAGIQPLSVSKRRDNIDFAVSVNRLNAFLDQSAATLSGGQQRRLNLAIGLLNNPEILYLDEPTVGIDPESRNDILETIKTFKEYGKTVVYTSHYMLEIEKICDEVVILDRGRIVQQGNLKTMLQEEGTDSVIIELACSSEDALYALAQKDASLQVIDATTLMLPTQEACKIADILAVLQANNIAVKHINFGAANLEALFIRQTRQGSHV